MKSVEGHRGISALLCQIRCICEILPSLFTISARVVETLLRNPGSASSWPFPTPLDVGPWQRKGMPTALSLEQRTTCLQTAAPNLGKRPVGSHVDSEFLALRFFSAATVVWQTKSAACDGWMAREKDWISLLGCKVLWWAEEIHHRLQVVMRSTWSWDLLPLVIQQSSLLAMHWCLIVRAKVDQARIA